MIPILFLYLGSLYFIQDQKWDYLQSQTRLDLKEGSTVYEQVLNKQIKNLPKNQNLSQGLIGALSFLFSGELSERTIAIFNKSGKILFSNKFSSDHLQLQKSLIKNSSLRSKWFVKINNKHDRSSNLFFVKRWKSSDIFLVTSKNIDKPALFAPKSSLTWIGVCFIFALFILGFLILVIQPLFLSYTSLKSAFIYLGKTGKVPFWLSSSKNPYLYFYKNWSFLISNKRRRTNDYLSDKPVGKTFKDVMEGEILKIKQKFPEMEVDWDVHSDIKVWNFSYFMKIICRELIFNAVESMGGSKSQSFLISCHEKNDWFFFSIRDKGVGFSKEDLKKALTLYYSTKSQLGVGLNIVQSIVSANNGVLKISPLADGIGTEVTVGFPVQCFLQNRFNGNEASVDDSFEENSDLQYMNYKENFYKKSLNNKRSQLS